MSRGRYILQAYRQPYKPGELNRQAVADKPVAARQPPAHEPVNTDPLAPQPVPEAKPPNPAVDMHQIRERLKRHVEAWQRKQAQQAASVPVVPPRAKKPVEEDKPLPGDNTGSVGPGDAEGELPSPIKSTQAETWEPMQNDETAGKGAATFSGAKPNGMSGQKPVAAEVQEKCAVFSGLVRDYEYRLSSGCSSETCTLYQRQLEKYRAKQDRYCSEP